MLRVLGVAALLAAVAGGPVAAGPDDIVKALKDRPASLFDLSLARLEALLGADAQANGYTAFANYQEDRIVIWLWSPDAPNTEAACKDLLDRVKRLAGVDPETGYPDNPASRFAGLFNYPQISAIDIDQTYDETVDAMFELRGTIGISGDGTAVSCRSDLLAKDTTYTRD